MNHRKWRDRLVTVLSLTCTFVGAFTDHAPIHGQVCGYGYCRYRLETAARNFHRHGRPNQSTSALYGMFDRNEELVGADRLKACVPYLLPLIDGDPFGAYIYERIPPLGLLDDITIGPLSNMARHIPFSTVFLFVALTIGTRFNLEMNRNVRFSAQQAALLDVVLIFPELIASSFQDETLPRALIEPLSTFVWYTYMSTVVYSVYSNLRGTRPDKIPYVSAFADELVGPL
jgi:Chloroplast import apparatus Tic20-like